MSHHLRTSSLPLCTALKLLVYRGNPVSDEISAQVSGKRLSRFYRGLRFGPNEWNALEEAVDSTCVVDSWFINLKIRFYIECHCLEILFLSKPEICESYSHPIMFSQFWYNNIIIMMNNRMCSSRVLNVKGV